MTFRNQLLLLCQDAVTRAAPTAPAVAASVPAAAPVAAAATAARPTLRRQFPFLSEPDCPVELQALVTRRVTRYHEYTSLYPRLRDCQTLAECADVAARLLDAYLDNRAMTRELEYYGRHRRVLGEHPFLAHYRQLTTLRAKTTRQLFEEKKRTQDNIWRAENEIRKGDKPHLDNERRKRIQQCRLKLQEINSLLGEMPA